VKLLVWHWGRHGAGPIFAARLSAALAEHPDTEVVLSLPEGAEVLAEEPDLQCGWREKTYRNPGGYALQRLAALWFDRHAVQKLRDIKPDFAICAMPALLDRRMVRALRRSNVRYAVVVHDATAHPGDGLRFRLLDQSGLLPGAAALFPLSTHVEAELRRQGYGTSAMGAHGQCIVKLWHPPFFFGAMRPVFSHGGRPRLLCFGRLLPYKGLDLLADALTALGPEMPFDVRICGEGPVSAELSRLAALPHVTVDQRWIPEAELPGLIEWADAVVLPYREASQSGVAAAAIGQGRLVVATCVGGLPEQLAGLPGAILCDPNAPAIAAALQRIKPAASPASAASVAANWNAMAARMLAALPR
jgi:glycosyltransferase involved in cell wall biosynthesis